MTHPPCPTCDSDHVELNGDDTADWFECQGCGETDFRAPTRAEVVQARRRFVDQMYYTRG